MAYFAGMPQAASGMMGVAAVGYVPPVPEANGLRPEEMDELRRRRVARKHWSKGSHECLTGKNCGGCGCWDLRRKKSEKKCIRGEDCPYCHLPGHQKAKPNQKARQAYSEAHPERTRAARQPPAAYAFVPVGLPAQMLLYSGTPVPYGSAAAWRVDGRGYVYDSNADVIPSNYAATTTGSGLDTDTEGLPAQMPMQRVPTVPLASAGAWPMDGSGLDYEYGSDVDVLPSNQATWTTRSSLDTNADVPSSPPTRTATPDVDHDTGDNAFFPGSASGSTTVPSDVDYETDEDSFFPRNDFLTQCEKEPATAGKPKNESAPELFTCVRNTFLDIKVHIPELGRRRAISSLDDEAARLYAPSDLVMDGEPSSASSSDDPYPGRA